MTVNYNFKTKPYDHPIYSIGTDAQTKISLPSFYGDGNREVKVLIDNLRYDASPGPSLTFCIDYRP